MQTPSDEAWNNFVMQSDPGAFAQDTSERAAAIANLFMGVTSNGGLSHFLESTYDLDAAETVDALHVVGAHGASSQLQEVISGLAIALPPMSQDDRWNALQEHWKGRLDDLDTLSSEAEDELMAALTRHVLEREAFYRQLGRS
ncbi:DUF4375 domain-containing protein [Sphingomonas sp. AR_OL41]|uniref:DMP19 family protein n=1 Tax=Sphingomonas sp. AR_OL41 TaxID=3042729 RepID=UPI00247FCED9|nr:DUF4375 domain-containing protein [Sphingomonas sp. AR_OL41]MDH7971283.1 DUF4375 domain-containing protein [Sphingomonas sp. AR_OL41]